MSIRTLAVEVLEGPDKGENLCADSDILTIGSAPGNDLVLTDSSVSGYHLELACRADGVSVTDLGSTNGTRLGNTKLQRATVPSGTKLTLGRTQLLIRDGEGATVPLHEGQPLHEMIGDTRVMRRFMAQVARAATSSVPTLLMGESGTGKEVAARAIHQLGTRADKPFITVDCGAFSPNLVASELFGHERGAFTGADRRHIGAFERADGGTIFLDEVGEIPLELQPQLLGALERQRFRRIGGQDEIKVDVQVVSATNRDLREEVNNGTFRLDLYFRLAVVVLRIPPLRERVQDIPRLVEHFMRECGHDGPTEDIVPSEVLASLLKHRWPGNVRELRNWVEATIAMGEAGDLGLEGAGGHLSSSDLDQATMELPYKDARATVLHHFEERYLKHLLKQCDDNVSRAARHARMDRSYLIKLLQRHRLR
ncbi:MAG TPA: sigma 54-dependent Fis family transcriptional regulator [Sorangium sp.]|nr:sigma 54-dependent Fis family transcriptional regulator [Sorangium sp.]